MSPASASKAVGWLDRKHIKKKGKKAVQEVDKLREQGRSQL
jgi:hypothetical protein